MNYKTYWSILDTPSHTIKPNIVALIIAVLFGLGWILGKNFKNYKEKDDKFLILWGTGIFSALSFLMFLLLTFIYPDFADNKTKLMLNSTSVKKVEGKISNFERRFRRNGKTVETIETFTIQNKNFAYGDAALGGFNSFTKTYNDVIYNGQTLRVIYSNGSPYGHNYNSILKIEIKK